ncbi:MAG: TonB-dependent receptor [Gammaproteobacteria bacterium]|nr:TonB-dependent receptor [Gammaproteobacteria bacterium]
MSLRKTVLLTALAALPLAVSMPAALAEEGAEAAESRPVTSLEEVIVTALRREQSLLQAPLAVSAFDGDFLEDIGAHQLADFLLGAPGTTIVDTGTGDTQIYIRGMSSFYGDGAVGYYLDEVPFGFLGLSHVPDVRTFDLDRIEVLRGPQGTLYGASSLGGTVRIITNDPVFNEFQGKVDVFGSGSRGGGDNYGVKAAVNVPLLDDRLAMRLVATTETYDGWLNEPLSGEEKVNDREVETLRAKLRFAPTENVNLVLGIASYDNAIGASNDGDDEGNYRNAFAPGALNAADQEYELASAILTISTQWFDIVSSTSWFDFEQSSGGVIDVVRTADTIAQELRVSTNDLGPWHVTAGVYYRDLSTAFAFEVPPFPPSTQDTTGESWAVFSEVTYSITDTLDATVGLRYFDDTRDRSDTVIAGFDFTTFMPIIETVEFEEKYSTTNPKFNLGWRPNENWLIYANAAKGFRSGFLQPGISLFIAEQVGLDIGNGAEPEKAWSYEIGAKARLADGRLVIETAAYLIDWDNLQTVISVIPAALGAITNAGKVKAKGIDLGITAAPVEGLELTLSGSYSDSKYGETVTDVGGIVVADGQRVQLFPEWTVSASASYRRSLGTSGLQGTAYLRMDHTTERSLNFGSVTTEGDKISQGSARVGVEGGHWGVYAFVDNLFDEDGKVTGGGIRPGFEDLATRLRPRTVGLNLRLSF